MVDVVVGGVTLALWQRAWKEFGGGAGIGIEEEAEEKGSCRWL